MSLRSLKRQCASALPVVHTHSLAERLCALLLPFVRTGAEVGRTNICARCRRRRCQRQTKRTTLPVMPEQSRVCCAVLPACLPDCQSARVRRFIHTVFGFRFSVHFERENCADVLAAEWQSSAWCNRHTHTLNKTHTRTTIRQTRHARTHARTQRKATVARNKNHALPATYTRSARSSYSHTRLAPPSNASTGAFTIFYNKKTITINVKKKNYTKKQLKFKSNNKIN